MYEQIEPAPVDPIILWAIAGETGRSFDEVEDEARNEKLTNDDAKVRLKSIQAAHMAETARNPDPSLIQKVATALELEPGDLEGVATEDLERLLDDYATEDGAPGAPSGAEPGAVPSTEEPTVRKKRELPQAFTKTGQFRDALKAMARHVDQQHEIEALGKRDWRVLRTLYCSGAQSGWKTLPAGLDWLASQTELPRTTVRRALAALERAGWLKTVPFKEAPKWTQKAALERQARLGGSLPRMIRLRVLAEELAGDTPEIYPEVPGLPWKQPAGLGAASPPLGPQPNPRNLPSPYPGTCPAHTPDP